MKKSPVAAMKKSPAAAIGNIREAVRRKSVGLSFTTSFSLFGRSTSSGGEGDGDGEADEDDEGARYNRSREDSAPRESDNETAPSPAVSSRKDSYVEPPEPPLPPPGGLLEAATVNVQGKMKSMMETFHEVTTSIVRAAAL
jgi:hypothetical protein